jgi:hypothetical protein
MTTIELPRLERPVDLIRRLVRAGLTSGVVLVVYWAFAQYDVVKECRGGAFSAGFSHGFDVRRCDLVIRRFGSDLRVHIPFPPSLFASFLDP